MAANEEARAAGGLPQNSDGAILSRPAEKVLSKLEGVKGGNGTWTARCPSHDDKRSSLSVSEDAGGKVLLRCHAGCEVEAVVAAMDLEMKDLFPDSGQDKKQKKVIVATYDYTDESGLLLYQAVRYQPKNFKQRRPDGKGGWIWSLKDTRRVLYRLPQIIVAIAAGETIHVVEGEKDADALAGLGLVATCNCGGAGKWRKEYSEALSGAHVVILPDNDEPGRDHATKVKAALEGIAAHVVVIHLPGLGPVLPKHGKDVSDWIAAGGTAQELQELVKNPPPEPETEAPPQVGFLFSEVKPEHITWLWDGRVPFGKLSILDGDPGQGKSTIALDVAARLSRGHAMPDGSGGGEPAGVVILSSEDGAGDTIRPRLEAAGADLGRIKGLDTCPDDDGGHPPVLPGDLHWIEEAIKSVDAKLGKL
ncbi:MAG: AAA family ATPase [Thermoleophilia bacterium]|nr:AAA family ATPase [Thermoleophilia bacterium]